MTYLLLNNCFSGQFIWLELNTPLPRRVSECKSEALFWYKIRNKTLIKETKPRKWFSNILCISVECDICIRSVFSPKKKTKCEIYGDRQHLCREWNWIWLNNGIKNTVWKLMALIEASLRMTVNYGRFFFPLSYRESL